MQINTQKAFTIVELLVTVTIIALLTAIITGNLATSKSKSRDAKRVSDTAQVQLALELFFDRCNRYPLKETSTLPAGWAAAPMLTDSGSGCPTGISLSTFISKIPTGAACTSAPTNCEYRYNVNDPASPQDYVIQAKLENYNQALQDDMDAPPSTAAGSGWDATGIANLVCTDSSSTGWYYCVQPR